MGNIKFVCDVCKKVFDKPRILYDSRQVGYDDFEDVYECPYCGSEDFKWHTQEECPCTSDSSSGQVIPDDELYGMLEDGLAEG